MKTSNLFAVLFMCPAAAGFGKSPNTALVKKSSCRWSSTGVQGLDHNNVQEVNVVNSVKDAAPTKPSNHDDAFLEHHPYASGSFTIDPKHKHI